MRYWPIMLLGMLLASPLSAQKAERVELDRDSVQLRSDVEQPAALLRCYAYTKTGKVINNTCDWVSRSPAIVEVTTPALRTAVTAKTPGMAWIVASRTGAEDSTLIAVYEAVSVDILPDSIECVIGQGCSP